MKETHKDLKTIYEIQKFLLPESPPKIPNYQIFGISLPAYLISGDYYDFFQIKKHLWGIAIADVSGKGVLTSLAMSMCKTLIRNECKRQNSPSPSNALKKINKKLYRELDKDMSISTLLIYLDCKKNTLTLARAGHPSPFHLKKDGSIETPHTRGIALGIDTHTVFDTLIEDLILPLEPGEVILMFTDGAYEALNVHDQEFSRERIKSIIKNNTSKNAEELATKIVEEIKNFSQESKQKDDITLVAIQNIGKNRK